MDLKSGLPFSLVKNGLVENYDKLKKNITTGVVIMGGGISGALTAYQLMLHGIPCIVVDGRSIGLGSTCASTSLLQYEIDVPLYELIKLRGLKDAVKSYHISYEAVQEIQQLANKINFSGIEKKESLYYAAFKKDIPLIKEEYRIRKEQGLPVNWLHESEMYEEAGFNAPGAIISANAAQTDAYLFTHCLHQHNIKKGVPVFDRTAITKIEHFTRSVHLVTEDGFHIKAKKLVYATGYETVKFFDKPIVKLNSTYAFVTESGNNKSFYWKNDRLIWNTADPYLYIRTTADNRIITGGRDEEFYSPSKRDDLIKSKTKQLYADTKKLFPAIDISPEFSWAGTFASTKDGLPFIGTYNKMPNSYFALGFGGNGITFSFIAAKIIAGLIKSKKHPNADLFSFNRF